MPNCPMHGAERPLTYPTPPSIQSGDCINYESTMGITLPITSPSVSKYILVLLYRGARGTAQLDVRTKASADTHVCVGGHQVKHYVPQMSKSANWSTLLVISDVTY